jgi:hypothetical protein
MKRGAAFPEGRKHAALRAALLVASTACCRVAPLPYSPRIQQLDAMHRADSGPSGLWDQRARLAITDPLAFLKFCRRHYLDSVSDYRCRFMIKERIKGLPSVEQQMDVLFREDPFSVDMRWVSSPAPAKRVNYVAGRYVKGGRELYVVEPGGVLGLLLPGGIKRFVDGPEARAAARRPINQFGFFNTLDLIISFCQRAQGDPRYDLRCVGRGQVEGRPTYVFERRLPFTAENDPYPDRLQVIHIDSEWLVPTACFSYADDEKEEMLGRYVTTSVEFNVGLTDADF